MPVEKNRPAQQRNGINRQSQFLLISLVLILCTITVYWPLKDHEFISFDDVDYVTDNPHVQQGLNSDSIRWAFTSFHTCNWHPLTWVSHMLDIQFFGLNPAAHHLVNLFFHVMSSLLLFMILDRMTRNVWRSAMVAFLFSLHPLHIESVAWVAERKDVLSAFFWMLTMGAYAFYVEKPTAGRYLAALLFFALGLLSKPMLVTLPFVLLLLDYWPLKRFQPAETHVDTNRHSLSIKNKTRKDAAAIISRSHPPVFPFLWSGMPPLVKEKIPFFLLSVLSSAVTIYAQQSAMSSLHQIPFPVRIGNAVVAYASYVAKMIWPQNLAVIYPHPAVLEPWPILLAAFLLLAITIPILWKGRLFPYLPVGWFWYLGTLVPVIGLVQVGYQSMADRYTYIPLIGLFIMVSWGFPEVLKNVRYQKSILAASSTLVILSLMLVSAKQVSYWKNSISLFEHCLQVTSNNGLAHDALGTALATIGKTEEAVVHFREALKIDPDDSMVQTNLGAKLAMLGKREEALVHFQEALKLDPRNTLAMVNMGIVLAKQGRTEEALEYFQNALRIRPDYADAHYQTGTVLTQMGRAAEAVPHFMEALKVNPKDSRIHVNLGYALAMQGKREEAIEALKRAIALSPDFAHAHGILGVIYYEQGNYDEAASQFREVLRISPEDRRAVQFLKNIDDKKK
jgi:protein O-mannosyl-transferase